MQCDLRRFKLMSRRPLYYVDDEREVTKIENEYCQFEIIRVFSSTGAYIDIDITERITLAPQLGMIFFSRRKDAVRWCSQLDVHTGRELLIENCKNWNRVGKLVEVLNAPLGLNIEDGMYSIPDYDELLMGGLEDELLELRYLDINSYDIKKIKRAEGMVVRYIRAYICSHDLQTEHSLENERLLFDVKYESTHTTGEAHVRIRHHFVQRDIYVNSGIICNSMIHSYKIFYSKEDALKYRYRLYNGESEYNLDILPNQLKFFRSNEMIIDREFKKERFWLFVNGVQKVVKPWINIDTILGYVNNKILPHMMKYGKNISDWIRNRHNNIHETQNFYKLKTKTVNKTVNFKY